MDVDTFIMNYILTNDDGQQFCTDCGIPIEHPRVHFTTFHPDLIQTHNSVEPAALEDEHPAALEDEHQILASFVESNDSNSLEGIDNQENQNHQFREGDEVLFQRRKKQPVRWKESSQKVTGLPYRKGKNVQLSVEKKKQKHQRVAEALPRYFEGLQIPGRFMKMNGYCVNDLGSYFLVPSANMHGIFRTFGVSQVLAAMTADSEDNPPVAPKAKPAVKYRKIMQSSRR